MIMQHLPEDVVQVIVDALAEDIHVAMSPTTPQQRTTLRTLRQCCLTSRSFHLAARRHLFRSVALSTVKRSVELLALLQTCPALARFIRVLSLRGGAPVESITVAEPNVPRSRARRLSMLFSKTTRARNQQHTIRIKQVNLASWLASSDGRHLLALLQDVEDLRIFRLESRMHAIDGYLFSQMSRIQSLHVAGEKEPSLIHVFGTIRMHLRDLKLIDLRLFTDHHSDAGETVFHACLHDREPGALDELLVENVENLRMLAMDVSAHPGLLSSVCYLLISEALYIPAGFRSAVTVAQHAFVKLRHLDIKLSSERFDVSSGETGIGGISSLQTLVVRGITRHVFPWITLVFSSLKISHLEEIHLHLRLGGYYSEEKACLLNLDEALSRKSFDALKTLALSVQYRLQARGVELGQAFVQYSLPRCYERGILAVTLKEHAIWM
jgi:hypothetical protein